MAQLITKTSVALEEKDRQIVNQLAQEKGLNFSSAVRFIIRTWDEMKAKDNGNKENRAQS